MINPLFLITEICSATVRGGLVYFHIGLAVRITIRPIKSENSPRCAVLMGSVASIIDANVIDTMVNTKYIDVNNFKNKFLCHVL